MAKENMMETTQITDMDAFASILKQKLEQAHPSASVEIHKAAKTNNLALTGVAIHEKGRNIAPAVYLEGFFEEYRNGKPLDEICHSIEEINQRATPDTDFDLSGVMDFSAVKEKICYKLVNAAKNAALLKDAPHRLWQDLAVIYYVPVSIESVCGFSSIMIDNRMLEWWGVDEGTLYSHAHKNTPALLHAEIMSLTEMLTGMPAGDSADLPQLYVATNDRQVNGAAVLLYDGVLEQFAGRTGGDFYILPSSIHETLFLPVMPDADEKELPEMVRGVNASGEVAPEEILSDNVYFYDSKDNSLRLIK